MHKQLSPVVWAQKFVIVWSYNNNNLLHNKTLHLVVIYLENDVNGPERTTATTATDNGMCRLSH